MINIDINKLMDKPGGGDSVVTLASLLFHSQTASHIMHLQTDSYARHMALNAYYDTIPDLIDRMIEGAQGYKGMILSGYNVQPVKDATDPLTYFKSLLEQVKTLRNQLPHPFLEQVADDVVELVSSTIYKLEQLK